MKRIIELAGEYSGSKYISWKHCWIQEKVLLSYSIWQEASKHHVSTVGNLLYYTPKLTACTKQQSVLTTDSRGMICKKCSSSLKAFLCFKSLLQKVAWLCWSRSTFPSDLHLLIIMSGNQLALLADCQILVLALFRRGCCINCLFHRFFFFNQWG